VVEGNNEEKVINLPKNNTILKLRRSIMSSFNLPCNFDMYSMELKRNIKFTEEEEFSVNSLSRGCKNPSVCIRNIRRDEKYPQDAALELFMRTLEKEDDFYKTLLKFLKN
jgi:hypothetical protein